MMEKQKRVGTNSRRVSRLGRTFQGLARENWPLIPDGPGASAGDTGTLRAVSRNEAQKNQTLNVKQFQKIPTNLFHMYLRQTLLKILKIILKNCPCKQEIKIPNTKKALHSDPWRCFLLVAHTGHGSSPIQVRDPVTHVQTPYVLSPRVCGGALRTFLS